MINIPSDGGNGGGTDDRSGGRAPADVAFEIDRLLSSIEVQWAAVPSQRLGHLLIRYWPVTLVLTVAGMPISIEVGILPLGVVAYLAAVWTLTHLPVLLRRGANRLARVFPDGGLLTVATVTLALVFLNGTAQMLGQTSG